MYYGTCLLVCVLVKKICLDSRHVYFGKRLYICSNGKKQRKEKGKQSGQSLNTFSHPPALLRLFSISPLVFWSLLSLMSLLMAEVSVPYFPWSVLRKSVSAEVVCLSGFELGREAAYSSRAAQQNVQSTLSV